MNDLTVFDDVRFHRRAGCATCDRALRLLRETGRGIRVRDLDADPFTWDQLRHLAGMAGGVPHLLSVQSPAYRLLEQAVSLSEPAMLHVVAANASLLRCPIIVADGVVLVGFDDRALAELAPRNGS